MPDVMTCARIDRDAGTVDVWDDNIGEVADVPYDGPPPAPLSRVVVTDPPARRVDRQLGAWRPLFWDDFTQGRSNPIAYSERTSTSAGTTSTRTTDINVTVTLAAGHRYRVSSYARVTNTSAARDAIAEILDGATRIRLTAVDVDRPASTAIVGEASAFVNGDGASHTFYLAFGVVTGGTAFLLASADEPVWIAVHHECCQDLGDTAWRIDDNRGIDGAGTSGINRVYPIHDDDAQGAVALDLVGVSQNWLYLAKGEQSLAVPDSAAGIWYSVRVKTPGEGSAATINVRLHDGPGNIYVLAQIDMQALGVIQLRCRDGGSIVAVNTGTTPTVDTWYDVDLVLIGNLYAALWVNGDGPWVVDDPAGLPDVGVGLHCDVGLANFEGSSELLYVDRASAQLVPGIQPPGELAIAGFPPVG